MLLVDRAFSRALQGSPGFSPNLDPKPASSPDSQVGLQLVKSRKEQVWFVALVFLGTGAVSVLAYLDKIGESTDERAAYPFVEASANAHMRPGNLEPGLSKHYFNRR